MLSLFSVAGCAHKPPPPDPVAIALAQSTARIAAAWRAVGAVSEAQHPESLDYLGDYNGDIPAALQEHISLRWAGPISGVVRKLADRVGWQYNEVGLPPANELPVFIDSRNRSIAQILRDIGYQAGGRADVIVKPSELRLEVVYD